MKTKALAVVLGMSFMTSLSYSQKTSSSGNKKPNAGWEFYLKTTQECCPEAYYILSTVSNGENYMSYAGTAKTDLARMEKLGTIVHEACHGLNADIGRTGEYFSEGYYIEPGKTMTVTHGAVYNSHELNQVVPKKTQLKIFRYNNYIGEKQELLTSQRDGVYGMLNEFSAYYNDALVAYKSKSWYEKTYGYTNPDKWVNNYVPDVGNSVMAFYEFRLFIAWYMERAQKKYPEQYLKIMENSTFREAYTLLYDRFENLSKEYETEIYRLEKLFNDKGFDVRIEEEFMQIYKKNSSAGSGHFLNDITWLKSITTPELEQILKDLRKE